MSWEICLHKARRCQNLSNHFFLHLNFDYYPSNKYVISPFCYLFATQMLCHEQFFVYTLYIKWSWLGSFISLQCKIILLRSEHDLSSRQRKIKIWWVTIKPWSDHFEKIMMPLPFWKDNHDNIVLKVFFCDTSYYLL